MGGVDAAGVAATIERHEKRSKARRERVRFERTTNPPLM
jgi:hypothetical protein